MRYAFLLASAAAAGVAAFFTWYTVRLLYVTRFLTDVPNTGAYTGAVVFPILAIVLAFGARWSWRKATPRQ